MDAQRFGRFIAELRKEKNMTQTQLAEKIGVTDKAVSRWERGVGFPDISLLEPLADALDISLLELMKSEHIEETEIHRHEAENVLSAAIETAEFQKQKERIQENRIILTGICTALIFSLSILLIDVFGWSFDTVLFTGIGVVFPVVCMTGFITLLLAGTVRFIRKKSCRHILMSALVFACALSVFFFILLLAGICAFPSQY